MTHCLRCGQLMNPEPHHDSILWCSACWMAWARGPVTQELSQEFIRDSIPPKLGTRDMCVCGAHRRKIRVSR
jgi:hypothetical protein